MLEEINSSLSEYFKLLRFKKKISQEELAKELGISRNTYSNWENNPVQLSLETLSSVSDKLGEDILIFFQEYVAKSNKNS